MSVITITKPLDGTSVALRADHDFDWLHQFGRVFRAFDQQDSGNICFGVQDGAQRWFIKYAGAPTVNYEGDPSDAIARLQQAMPVYEAIQHPSLIRLIDHGPYGDGYAAIFAWAEGECLHAHWNFAQHPKYTDPLSPNYRFRRLPLRDKLVCFRAVLDLHTLVARKGYVAIDFYDGSIMYDFTAHGTTVCDIDFYQKAPCLNTMGRLWGSKRFMAPEEFQLGAVIDEVTNVYTMGATAFELLGDNGQRTLDGWQAGAGLFAVARRATNADRRERYPSIAALSDAWEEALKAEEE